MWHNEDDVEGVSQWRGLKAASSVVRVSVHIPVTFPALGCTLSAARSRFVHGYNGERPTIERSAAETERKCVPISPTECSAPAELGYARVGR